MADEEEPSEVCVGSFCFQQPYSGYLPPPYYSRTREAKTYGWKFEAMVEGGPSMRCKLQRVVAFPNHVGLGRDGRWLWQWIPLSMFVGVTMDASASQNYEENRKGLNVKWKGLRICPSFRLQILTPIFANLSLQPVVKLLPNPSLYVKREFSAVTAKLTIHAHTRQTPRWFLQLDWHPSAAVKMILQPVKGLFTPKYSRVLKLPHDCQVAVSAAMEVPAIHGVTGGLYSSMAGLLTGVKFGGIKIILISGSKAARTRPLKTSVYRHASEGIGTVDYISVIPGHWIDPGFELGAPGEREFNFEVANILEKQLRGNGWKVLRPDRDSPHLTWEEYLNWVSKQTSKGIPVLEVHGQGSDADYRGLVLGVIGDAAAPLNKELAQDFGYFKMDWRSLGVPRRGGVVLECFNSDEVLQMAPWHRTFSARRLANKIVSSIEQASQENRVSRGIVLESDI